MLEIFKNFCTVLVLFQVGCFGLVGLSVFSHYLQERKHLKKRNEYLDSL